MAEELKIWCLLKAEGFNDYAVAGIMTNLYAESGLNPKNLEDTYNNAKGISDEEYTKRVDDGTYKNFVNDGAGYGIAQWTYSPRKRNLYLFTQSLGVSIGDLTAQLKFLVKELKEDFPGVYRILMSATSVEAASNAVLLDFERPKNAMSKRNYRTSLGINYYLKYKGKSEYVETEVQKPTASTPKSKETLVTLSLPLIKYGSIGPTVKALQILLNGYDCPCGRPDGEVGQNTENGIMKYQRENGLDVDGEAGVQVFTSLLT